MAEDADAQRHQAVLMHHPRGERGPDTAHQDPAHGWPFPRGEVSEEPDHSTAAKETTSAATAHSGRSAGWNPKPRQVPEKGRLDRCLAVRVASRRREQERALAAVGGVEIEDKRFSVALHYRKALSQTEAELAIARAVETLAAARVIAPRAARISRVWLGRVF